MESDIGPNVARKAQPEKGGELTFQRSKRPTDETW